MIDPQAPSPYNTRSSSHQRSTHWHLNFGGNWSDGTPAIANSSTSDSESLGVSHSSSTMTSNGKVTVSYLVKHANSWVLATPAFLTHTTLTTIEEELEDVRTDLIILVSRERTEMITDFKARADALLGFYTSLLKDPLSGTSIPTVFLGWEALNSLDVGERQISLLLHAQRSCIMLTNYVAWYWLDVCIRDACNSIMDEQVDCLVQCPWLVRLVRDVEEAHRLRYPQHQFEAPITVSPFLVTPLALPFNL